jgi:site-specific recombinase XerC
LSKPYLLKPTFDHKHGKWRLNLPAVISPSGKRERHLFKKHHEALAEANRLRKTFHDFGKSMKMLPANRLIEAIECWQQVDEAFAQEAPPGALRKIVRKEVQAIQEREKSVTLGELLDNYLAKLKRAHRSENYLKQFRWLKGYLDFWLETKVSDLTPGNIRFSLQKLPSGNFNSNVRLLRAVLNHGIKHSWLKSNPAQQLEFVHRPKVEVKCLSHLIVEKMFRHAQEQEIELIPPWTIGFFCGLRESELWQIDYAEIRLEEKYVLVPAEISKVRRKRIIPLSENAIDWLHWYFERRGAVCEPATRLMSEWTPNRLRASRQANFEAATGPGAKWQQNCKRRAFASHFLAAYQSLDRLAMAMGHSTTELTFERYIGAVSQEAGLAYFQIRP